MSADDDHTTTGVEPQQATTTRQTGSSTDNMHVQFLLPNHICGTLPLFYFGQPDLTLKQFRTALKTFSFD